MDFVVAVVVLGLPAMLYLLLFTEPGDLLSRPSRESEDGLGYRAA